MSDGCPACGSERLISVGRNASGSWKCASCGHAFDDFGAAPTVTAYAAKEDEPQGYATDPRDPIPQRPIRDSWRDRAAWFSTPGNW